MRPGDATVPAGWPVTQEVRRRRLTIALPVAGRRKPLFVAGGLLLLLACALAGTGFDYERLPPPRVSLAPPDDLDRDLSRLRNENKKLERTLAAQVPSGVHLVINQTHNRLYVRRGDKTIHEAVCSAGSGMVLNEPTGQKRTWVFDTPRGRFRVLYKVENPVWKKPDWAFIEEGKPLPRRADERIEYGVLGEYALHFGNGYMIHGTLYERMLGRSVTHGCIRLGKEDLRTVYRVTPPGTPIYIF
jgi:L,D-transpeptidase YbiS